MNEFENFKKSNKQGIMYTKGYCGGVLIYTGP